jgi:bacterial/archaeal transporter family-2 protein
MNWLAYVLSLAAGAANPVQSGANAELRKQLGSVLWSGFIVYLAGMLGVLVLQLIWRHSVPSAGRISQVSWWAWTGGVVSIASTLAGIALVQRLGSGSFTGLNITAALVSSVVIDHFGWLGLQPHPASPTRLAGCGILVIGLWMITQG